MSIEKTSQQYEQEALDHKREASESFDRCDTDGFLSQWASGVNAQLATARAQLVRDGKKAEFEGLYEGNKRIPAQITDVPHPKFKWQRVKTWILRDQVDIRRFGRKFIPCGSNSRVQKNLGLCEKIEVDDAWAELRGKGHGLSGSCWVQIERTDEWGTNAKPIDEGRK